MSPGSGLIYDNDGNVVDQTEILQNLDSVFTGEGGSRPGMRMFPQGTEANIYQGTLAGAGQIIGPFDVSDIHGVMFQMQGTFNLTWFTEISIDGVNWESLPVHQDSQLSTIYQSSSAGSTSRLLSGNVNALQFRIRCSAYTSGSASFTIALCPSPIFPTTANFIGYVQGMVAEDAAAGNTNAIMTGLVASSAQRAAMSADGDLVRPWGDRRGRTITKRLDELLARITTAATTTALSGAGHLGKIILPAAATGAITVYDNTAGSGTVLATFAAGAIGVFEFDVRVGTGITVVTAAADQVIVTGSN
jgi:hypothetical protein